MPTFENKTLKKHPALFTEWMLFWDSQEAGYEHPTIENLDDFKEELIQELEEGILPIIEKRCYQNPSAKRNEEESQIPQC